MPQYGPWQPGLEHTLATRRSNGSLFWEPTEWSSPTGIPLLTMGSAARRTLADVHGIGFPEWDTGDYLLVHGLVDAASQCAYTHARAPHQHQQLWWLEDPDYPAECDPLTGDAAGRGWLSSPGSDDRVYVDYSYGGGIAGDATTWIMRLQQQALMLFPPSTMPTAQVSPPSEWWPDGALYVEYDPQPLQLVDMALAGLDVVAQTADSDRPFVFLRLWRDGEEVGHWWPGDTIGDEGWNLVPDPATIREWPRLVETEHFTPTALTDWVEAATIDDGAKTYLSVTVMPQSWLTAPAGFGGTVNGSESYDVSFPEFRLTFRSSPWRYVFADTPGLPPTRVFPRDDGLVTASAQRVWPPPRSVQGSPRRGPGSYV